MYQVISCKINVKTLLKFWILLIESFVAGRCIFEWPAKRSEHSCLYETGNSIGLNITDFPIFLHEKLSKQRVKSKPDKCLYFIFMYCRS